jgi:hypothetical protein
LSEKTQPEWDPKAGSVLQDQITAYDQLRKQCPVAHSEYLHWSLFRHAEVMRTLIETETFSNAVSSRHVAVPNGMDPPEHTEIPAHHRSVFQHGTNEEIRTRVPGHRRQVNGTS